MKADDPEVKKLTTLFEKIAEEYPVFPPTIGTRHCPPSMREELLKDWRYDRRKNEKRL